MNRRLLIAAVLAIAAPAAAQSQHVSVEAPWARASIGSSRFAVAYMTLRNPGTTPDRLVAITTPVGRAELHTMTMDNDVMRMRPVEAVDIPAGGSATLQPNGLHIMLLDLREPLRAGTQLPLTLRFEHASTLEISVPVQPTNTMHAPDAAPATPTMQMPMHNH